MKRAPKIRAHQDVEGEPFLVLRDSVSISFYLQCEHSLISHRVRHALEVYRRAVGMDALDEFDTQKGEWDVLDEKGWGQVDEWLSRPHSARIHLRGRGGDELAFGFTYLGKSLEDPLARSWGLVPTSAVEFWLPTEFLEAQGPERVRALVLELAEGLPFNSGEVGLAFRMRGWLQSNIQPVRAAALRHPGIGLSGMDELTDQLGALIRGPAWLTFLGSPVLDKLGGSAGLRDRLTFPGTTVRELDGSRAMVSLGEWPEAGDLEAGDRLAHYRELARVLEPWLYRHEGPWGSLTPEEIRRWERRFLD
ncbi:DUF3396 domain-containing protein [Myxococcus sp. CA056]|uniref:type VI immunity family protein n=1 Tax=Myxococcus sp. CA056 TaxID=2741740 RepID=UPI00157B7F64|nr:type VI immunity family protein [Myxococcus sp. CA056]NTX12589.1 DUF3396 domain-containing protein [Myxococcus sp. CA056]